MSQLTATSDNCPPDISSEQGTLQGEEIRVTGIVQGVGFRPFVWQLAQQQQISGYVWNDAAGVVIQAWGTPQSLTALRQQLIKQAPPLAKIDQLCVSSITTASVPGEFTIISSQQGEVSTDISPDSAVCPACLAEINDPANRRYRYPFTNCTHCGPRFSIIKAIPYDRQHTSMHSFPMCPSCQQEYDNPQDRRFHAQPNACPDCGPTVWLEDYQQQTIKDSRYLDDIAHAAELIKQGYILAIKGIGGFHLACDATNQATVERLRQRKQRQHKPFALMARDIAVIRQYATVDADEAKLLQHSSAPIVLLAASNMRNLAEEVAPLQNSLGFMLPYTPLHTLLLRDFDIPLVMTSANRSDEAQCISNTQAHQALHDIADYYLLHNREIVNRLDDSVARVIQGRVQLLRRARGFAPLPLKLPASFSRNPQILALGGELKNTFCLVKNDRAILAQHQGDLEEVSIYRDFQKNIDLYQRLYQHQPEYIVIDQHPEYLSGKFGQQLAADDNSILVKVQHHHAHICACMAEHGLPQNNPAVLGIVFDGLGYGEAGELWGGEFLLADYRQYQRIGSVQAVALPGASRAMYEPWRNALAHLHQALGWNLVTQQYPQLAFTKYMQDKPVANLLQMIEMHINSPAASSIGRLFEAVAAILGICTEQQSYEGQAAIILENQANAVKLSELTAYPVTIDEPGQNDVYRVNWTPFWLALLDDLSDQRAIQVIAGRFHLTLINVVTEMVRRITSHYDFTQVVLSGGVFQNRILLTGVVEALERMELSVLFPLQVPANDGGIALGQAIIVAARTHHTSKTN